MPSLRAGLFAKDEPRRQWNYGRAVGIDPVSGMLYYAAEGAGLFVRQGDGKADLRGVIHCFTGDYAAAQNYLDLGFYLSFTGIVTFKNAAALREVVRRVPLERIFVETDSPYLTPVPNRGKRNEPAYARLVAETIAQVKNLPLEEVARATTANVQKLFGI